jgi:phage gp36-like protein
MGYVSYAEFVSYGMNQRGIDTSDRAAIELLADAISEEFDSYANPQHQTPFLVGSKSLPAVKRSICAVTVYEYMASRGFEMNAATEVVALRAEQARKWWLRISEGKVRLDVVDQTPTVREGGAVVLSRPTKWP